ncbi:DNA polymerase I [Dehalobacter sp. DCM]|uniref:DNA polymerase I n=1 Tax=Dehalobacter sp. DCM TaxID=2907827 RepID=UPI003081FB90|nr:DNA polymerase I [Dehalobacter sp. DCM]
MPHMLILDGNSLINRAFYALPPLTSADGRPTNAVHGFLTMLFRLQKEQKPDYWVVAFDKTKATVRIEQYEGYKAHRKETPETLKPQFGYLKDILQAMSVPILELGGYEADDIIATVNDLAIAHDINVSIFTGDKDALQLINPRTNVLLTVKGISEVESYNAERLYERYELTPAQIIDLKGLMGDTSDNIPGIPGVGEKTALKLLHEFGSVENVLQNKDKVSGKKLNELLNTYAEQALLSKKLAAMIHDVPVEHTLEQLRWQEPNRENSKKILHHYSLYKVAALFEQSLAAVIGGEGDPENPSRSAQKRPVSKKDPANLSDIEQKEFGLFSDSIDDLVRSDNNIASEKEAGAEDINQPEKDLDGESWLNLLQQWLEEKPLLALSYRHNGSIHQGQWTEMGICDEHYAYTLKRCDQPVRVLALWDEILADDTIRKIVADSKSLYSLMGNEGKQLAGIDLDLSLASYLLNPSRTNFSVCELLRDHITDLFSLTPAREASLLRKMASKLAEEIAENGMEKLLHEIEEPLSKILAQMEKTGIAVDKAMLSEFGSELDHNICACETEIYHLAGENFNINSPQQLGKILFENLGLPPLKKTKTGYSTDAETLEELLPEHPIIEKLLNYRQLVKLNSTYVKGLLAQIRDDKIHTTFQQTVTATGRLSSTEPNLQNIPIRLEEGRKLRKVFRPGNTDWVLFSADYSQIELRILAHYSKDPILCQSFISEEDVHRRTAAEVFGVPLESVTKDMRRKAKAVNFGLMYGLTDFGLARDLAISRKEAKYYITQYFERYQGVNRYLEEAVIEAKENGEIRTLLNRLRKIPELAHPNRMTRQFGERIAKNSPIQGTAADIMKIAMIKVDEALKGLQADMLLQVHDELVIQIAPDELAEAANKVIQAMEGAYPLAVPLVVDCKVGNNWYDMVPYTV